MCKHCRKGKLERHGLVEKAEGCRHGGRCRHGRRHHGGRGRRAALSCLALWDLGWKAVAIHKAVESNDKKWVLPLALVNSVGVLPIVYLVESRKHSS